MPWNVKDTMSLRQEFVSLAAAQSLPFSELCRRFNISRQTGYKWLECHRDEGSAVLADRSRRPHHSPTRSPAPLVERVLALRREYGWGEMESTEIHINPQ
ncbi:helix-turn-helix domain-containing protein [Paraburkholderia mimosarum]|uniref:helix-turn-helix domain-containing protein n=1 Tax=Paraburkholderia mimosarum TaxID=312026 RepID=UPI0005A87AD2|nr:leucine zipper domain-containing protein [Paraburkholderia mimosarum]